MKNSRTTNMESLPTQCPVSAWVPLSFFCTMIEGVSIECLRKFVLRVTASSSAKFHATRPLQHKNLLAYISQQAFNSDYVCTIRFLFLSYFILTERHSRKYVFLNFYTNSFITNSKPRIGYGQFCLLFCHTLPHPANVLKTELIA